MDVMAVTATAGGGVGSMRGEEARRTTVATASARSPDSQGAGGRRRAPRRKAAAPRLALVAPRIGITSVVDAAITCGLVARAINGVDNRAAASSSTLTLRDAPTAAAAAAVFDGSPGARADERSIACIVSSKDGQPDRKAEGGVLLRLLDARRRRARVWLAGRGCRRWRSRPRSTRVTIALLLVLLETRVGAHATHPSALV